jgi:hypothetical protein
MRAARVSASVVGIVVALTIAIYSSQTYAQNVCAQLQQSIQTLRSSGGAGSEWEAMAIRQLRENGCLGGSSLQQPQIPPGSTRCGTAYCQAGTKCARNGSCIASDAVDCGKFACSAGNTCTRDGCRPLGAVACGSGYCNAGLSCVSNQCVAPQQAASGNFLMRYFSSLGSPISSRAPNITGNQSLSSAVQQRNVQTMPTPYGLEKLLNDPYVGKPMPASQLPRPSVDLFGSHPIESQSPQQPTVRPAAPAVQTGQQQPTNGPAAPAAQTAQPTTEITNTCGAGHRTMRRGTFVYCEIWIPKPE